MYLEQENAAVGIAETSENKDTGYIYCPIKEKYRDGNT
jgi:hypothetical protein